jgi:hypothetical protein
MPYYFLRIGSDYLEEAAAYRRKSSAVAVFAEQARELARYDQRLEASIHIADSRDELAEYPDFVLSLGPRGGVRVERA